MASTRCSRFFALLMLGSVLTGVFAPGAVAVTRDDIRAASERTDLSADVRDFFTKALEDAMVRAALVGPISASSTPTVRRPGPEYPDLVMAPGALESVSSAPSMLPAGSSAAEVSASQHGAMERTGPLHPRAP
ncbi:MAG: hypothetical protein O3C45_04180 [Bacteroidetes bacterium]|nr:hypothetical protein [Bacteroidota bacterium]MDA0874242.1 hypothetical protein [Bacteroidota bacterium]